MKVKAKEKIMMFEPVKLTPKYRLRKLRGKEFKLNRMALLALKIREGF